MGRVITEYQNNPEIARSAFAEQGMLTMAQSTPFFDTGGSQVTRVPRSSPSQSSIDSTRDIASRRARSTSSRQHETDDNQATLQMLRTRPNEEFFDGFGVSRRGELDEMKSHEYRKQNRLNMARAFAQSPGSQKPVHSSQYMEDNATRHPQSTPPRALPETAHRSDGQGDEGELPHDLRQLSIGTAPIHDDQRSAGSHGSLTRIVDETTRCLNGLNMLAESTPAMDASELLELENRLLTAYLRVREQIAERLMSGRSNMSGSSRSNNSNSGAAPSQRGAVGAPGSSEPTPGSQ